MSKKTIHKILSPLKIISPHLHTKVYRAVSGYNRKLARLTGKEILAIQKTSTGHKRRLFIDCGVNEGFVLKSYADALSGFSIEGFEIQANLVAHARKVVPSAKIYHAAVTAENGEIDIYLPATYGENYRGGSSTLSNAVPSENLFRKERCKAIRLSEHLRKARTDDGMDYIAIKMDIEGAEYAIIEDLHQLWKEDGARLIDYLTVEFHPKLLAEGDSQARYEAMLKEMGIHYSAWV